MWIILVSHKHRFTLSVATGASAAAQYPPRTETHVVMGARLKVRTARAHHYVTYGDITKGQRANEAAHIPLPPQEG